MISYFRKTVFHNRVAVKSQVAQIYLSTIAIDLINCLIQPTFRVYVLVCPGDCL